MVDRNATVNLRGDVSNYVRSLMQARTATSAFIRSLDSSNDRMSMLVQTGLALGPALAPIGVSAVPALAGLTNQLSFAAIGAGAAVLAFAGVGDALKSVNEFALEPTEANLEKMRESLDTLGPAGQEFVAYLQSLRPEMQRLQSAAQEGLFPGLMVGMDELTQVMPQVESIISEVSSATGQLMAEAGDNLNDPRWREFFGFLESEARPTLIDLGHTIGNFAEGFAQLWMAFDPISDQFSRSFLNMSRDFNEWASGLSETQGFEDFVDYLARIGPKVWDTLGSLGEALLAVATAAAPVGEAALPVIEALAETLTAVAESPAGPALIAAAAGLSAISRAVALYNVAQGSQIARLLGGSVLGGAARAARDLPRATGAFLDFGAALDRTGRQAGGFRNSTARLGAALGGAGRLTAGAAGGAMAVADLGDSFALANTTSYALIGTMAGPWGTAAGAAVGAAQDLRAANDDLATAVENANTAMRSMDLDQINAAMAELKGQIDDGGGIGQKITNIGSSFSGFTPGLSILDNMTTSTSEASFSLARLEIAQTAAKISAQNQKFAEAGLAGEMDGASASARNQVEALLDSAAAKNANRDAALQGRAAERELEAALDAAAESARENGATFDITTEAGRANEEAIDAIAAAWNNLGVEEQMLPGRHEQIREQFINTAVSMGRTRADAEALADELLDIPADVSTVFETPGARESIQTAIELAERLGLIPPGVSSLLQALDRATPTVNNVRNGVSGLNGLTATVRIAANAAAYFATIAGLPGIGSPLVAVASVMGAMGRADGGVTDYYANGGVRENHVAQIAPAGAWRVWAEPETGGEAYIPLARSKRARSRQVASETVSRLGGQVQWFADGGFFGGAVSAAELLRLRIRIRDLERDLRAGGKDRLRGLDRTLAQQELREAKSELAHARSANRRMPRGYSADAWNATRDRAADMATDFDSAAWSSPASLERFLSRKLAESAQFTQVLADLKRAGGSPWLLEQLIAAGPSKASIRTARALISDTARLKRLNAMSGQLGQVSDIYGRLTDPRFLQAGSNWGSLNASQQRVLEQTVNVNVARQTDPDREARELLRMVKHYAREEAMRAGI